MAKATKAAHERANQLGVNIDDVEGTGRGGQVTASDVENFQPEQDEEVSSQAVNHIVMAPQPAPFPVSEVNANRAAQNTAITEAKAMRARLTTTSKDLQDARENAQKFVEVAGRAVAAGKLEIDEEGEPVDPIVSKSSVASDPDKETDVAEDQKVRLAFNPQSGTNAIHTEHGSFEAGSEVDGATFNFLKTLKTDGVLIIDEDASQNVDESGNSAEEEQANAANLKADGNESEDSDERGSDAQSETASADEQKED